MRLAGRFIPREVILAAVASYGMVEAYPDDKYLPSYVILAARVRTRSMSCSRPTLKATIPGSSRRTGRTPVSGSLISRQGALGRLRQKMYRGLATRHVTGSPGAYRMLHDRLSGRIASDSNGGVVLVVDGVAVGIEDLASILMTHEGWGFELQIVDALE
jgi:hypothetical protein